MEAQVGFLRKQTEIKLYEVRMGKTGQSPTHQLNAQLYSQSDLGSNLEYVNHLGDLQQ